jgi:hypothetical protein
MSEETQVTDSEGATPIAPVQQRRKKEHFLGTILLVLIIFFILCSVVGIAFVGYTQWKHAKEVAARPTIEALTEEPAQETPAQAESPKEEPKEETTTESADIKKEKIAILNGGAAAGSAAKLAETLKKEGLEAITTGSTEDDFSGTVIYYAPDKKSAAESVLALLKKESPSAEAKPADASKKETSQETITIILGTAK